MTRIVVVQALNRDHRGYRKQAAQHCYDRGEVSSVLQISSRSTRADAAAQSATHDR